MKLFIMLISGTFISINASAEWKNPSERYMNSYKMFVEAKCPVVQDKIKHFVYFSRDRKAIHNHPILNNSRFEGAQIMYSWVQLESTRGKYDLCAFKS